MQSSPSQLPPRSQVAQMGWRGGAPAARGPRCVHPGRGCSLLPPTAIDASTRRTILATTAATSLSPPPVLPRLLSWQHGSVRSTREMHASRTARQSAATCERSGRCLEL